MAQQSTLDFFYWTLVKILKKKDQHTLSEKKARQKLLKKSSTALGLDITDRNLEKFADAFFAQARISGSIHFSGKYVSLPPEQPPATQNSKELAQEPHQIQRALKHTHADTETEAGGQGGASTARQQAQYVPQGLEASKKEKKTEQQPERKPEDFAAPKKKRKKQKVTEPVPEEEPAAPETRIEKQLHSGVMPRGTAVPEKKKKGQKKLEGEAEGHVQPSLAGKHEGAERQPQEAVDQQISGKQCAAAADRGPGKKQKKKKRKRSEGGLEPESRQSGGSAAAQSRQADAENARSAPQARPAAKAAVEPDFQSEAAESHKAKRRKKRKGCPDEQAVPADEAPLAAAAAAEESPKAVATVPAAAPKVSPAKAMPGIPWAAAVCDTGRTWRQDMKRTDVKRGRFSESERETIKQAIKDYAQEHGLSQTDLQWLYSTRDSSKEHREKTKGAWLAIGASLPHRQAKAVWACGTRMLHLGNHLGTWTKEEVEKLKELHAAKGARWKEIGDALGRLPEAVRDKYKSLKLGDARAEGKWTPEEEGKLMNLVTKYLAERPAPVDLKGRLVLDDVPWDAISRQHGSRDQDQCRLKWTTQLSPSMVERGDWALGDDRRMLKALFRAAPEHEWQVDWGALVAGRDANITRRRWRLMLKCVPDSADRSFPDCIDFLVTTYTPDFKKAAAVPAEAA